MQIHRGIAELRRKTSARNHGTDGYSCSMVRVEGWARRSKLVVISDRRLQQKCS
jgi:hypothetical protein